MNELLAGHVIDNKYRIVKKLGEGGMGAVYEGENIKIHRRVAIKTLHAGVADNSDVVGRFEREATAAGRIGNSHILEVLDLGEMPSGDRYMVMELLDGEPLGDRIERLGRLDAKEVARYGIQVCEGLAAAHQAGIVHRDLKPDNIFILREHVGNKDFIKIIDFGISKFQPLSGEGEGMHLTRTGALMGTPYYMSPEQASGSRDADARSDLYSVGVILYQGVAGTVPFDAPTFNQLLFKIVLSEPEPVTAVVPDIDPGFASIIQKAMAREPESRFQTADELKAALEDWLSTGAAVSVPPPVDDAARKSMAMGSERITTVAANKAVTSGSWASTASGASAKKSRGLMIAATAVGALALGAVGVVFALGGGKADSDVPAAVAEAPEQAPASLPPAPEVTPAEEPADDEANDPKAKESESASNKDETESPEKTPEAESEEAPPASAAPPVVKAPAPRPTPIRRAPRPRRVVAPKPAPKAAPKPAATTLSDDDFGY